MAIMRVRNDDGSISEVTVIKGNDGKSAYRYALDSGYTGTEAEFATKLAEESPKTFYIHISQIKPECIIDKSYDEILNAYRAGKTLIAIINVDDYKIVCILNLFEQHDTFAGTNVGVDNNTGGSVRALLMIMPTQNICSIDNVPLNGSLTIQYGDTINEYNGANDINITIQDIYKSVKNNGYTGTEDDFYKILASIPSVKSDVDTLKEDMDNHNHTISDIECSTDDNGKFLRVVNGVATWQSIESAEGVSF